MRKIMISLIIFTIILSPFIFSQKTTIADQSSISVMKDWGNILKSKYRKKNNEIFAKGNHCIIDKTELEQAVQYYLLTGLTKEKAGKAAVKYTFEREALYQAAVNNGFAATKEEIHAYLEELKQMIEGSGNEKDIKAMIAQFDTPEEYWNFEYTVYEKNLPIQNFVKKLQKEFNERVENQMHTKEKESWDEYFQQFKDDLVQKENFQIIDEISLSAWRSYFSTNSLYK